jgi:hypothetical protein
MILASESVARIRPCSTLPVPRKLSGQWAQRQEHRAAEPCGYQRCRHLLRRESAAELLGRKARRALHQVHLEPPRLGIHSRDRGVTAGSEEIDRGDQMIGRREPDSGATAIGVVD